MTTTTFEVDPITLNDLDKQVLVEIEREPRPLSAIFATIAPDFKASEELTIELHVSTAHLYMSGLIRRGLPLVNSADGIGGTIGYYRVTHLGRRIARRIAEQVTS